MKQVTRGLSVKQFFKGRYKSMRKFLTIIGLVALLAPAGIVYATPSTQIWIPSTDIQEEGVVHLGVDNYNTIFKEASDGAWSAPTNYGLTVGAFSNEKMGLEVGIDMREAMDDPILFNAKLGLYEGAMFDGSPELAFGGYEFGTESGTGTTTTRTDANILYGLVAKTFGDVGRFSGGFYSGNDNVLVDENGQKDASGVLLSWDRSFGEKFWGAVDYMGGVNAYGALSFGVSYALSDKTSFIVGYDIFNNNNLAENTMTFQLDTDF